MACRKLGPELGKGFTHEDGTRERLSYDDIVQCFIRKAKLTKASFITVHRVFRDAVVKNDELMEDIRSLHFDDAKTGYIDAIDALRALCAKCYEMVGESGRQDEQRREIFCKLPEMMGVEVDN